MKHVWAGTLSAGLVNVPVWLGTAAAGEDNLPLHYVRRSDGSRLEMRRFAKADGKEVAWDDTRRGYDTPAGQTVVLEKADFERAYGAKNREAKIVMFIGADQLPPRSAVESVYFVQPTAAPGAEAAYALLAQAMRETGKTAVVSFAMRQREAYALLHATEDGYLFLERLRWAAGIGKPDFAAPSAELSAAQVELAARLVETMAGSFDWAAQTDRSAEELGKVIAGKIETGQLTGTPAAPGSNPAPLDLTAVLQASVEKAAADRAAAAAPARKPRAPRKPKQAVKAA